MTGFVRKGMQKVTAIETWIQHSMKCNSRIPFFFYIFKAEKHQAALVIQTLKRRSIDRHHVGSLRDFGGGPFRQRPKGGKSHGIS